MNDVLIVRRILNLQIDTIYFLDILTLYSLPLSKITLSSFWSPKYYQITEEIMENI